MKLMEQNKHVEHLNVIHFTDRTHKLNVEGVQCWDAYTGDVKIYSMKPKTSELT